MTREESLRQQLEWLKKTIPVALYHSHHWDLEYLEKICKAGSWIIENYRKEIKKEIIQK